MAPVESKMPLPTVPLAKSLLAKMTLVVPPLLTCKVAWGSVVPIPTLPSEAILTFSVAAVYGSVAPELEVVPVKNLNPPEETLLTKSK